MLFALAAPLLYSIVRPVDRMFKKTRMIWNLRQELPRAEVLCSVHNHAAILRGDKRGCQQKNAVLRMHVTYWI